MKIDAYGGGRGKEKCTITYSKLFSYVIYKLALKLDKNTQ